MSDPQEPREPRAVRAAVTALCWAIVPGIAGTVVVAVPALHPPSLAFYVAGAGILIALIVAVILSVRAWRIAKPEFVVARWLLIVGDILFAFYLLLFAILVVRPLFPAAGA